VSVVKAFFVATSLLEVSAGLGFLVMPTLAIELLFGASGESAVVLVVGRIAGAALVSLGIASGMSSGGSASRSTTGLLLAMLFYNVGVALILSDAGILRGASGILLWPEVAAHVVMSVWNITCLWAGWSKKA